MIIWTTLIKLSISVNNLIKIIVDCFLCFFYYCRYSARNCLLSPCSSWFFFFWKKKWRKREWFWCFFFFFGEKLKGLTKNRLTEKGQAAPSCMNIFNNSATKSATKMTDWQISVGSTRFPDRPKTVNALKACRNCTRSKLIVERPPIANGSCFF